MHHELVHGRSQICGKGGQSHIFRGSKGVGVTIESYGKLEISYKMCVIFKMAAKHGIQMGGKNSALSDIIKIRYVCR